MNREEIFDKVQDIFRDIFDDQDLTVEDTTNASNIDDWDSLNQVNLIVAFEKEFKVKFNFQEVSQLKNVGEMVDLTMQKMK